MLFRSDDVLALLPRITKDRDRLSAAMSWRRLDFDVAPRGVPFKFLTRASYRRDLARAAGDLAVAHRWQAIIDTHMSVLADRDRVIALILWHRLLVGWDRPETAAGAD